MFVTNHVLAGALVGAALRDRPASAFAAGVLSHVAMDLTPHWGDAHLGADGFYVVARRDGLLGLAAIAAVTAAARPPRAALLAGIAGAALLDLDKPAGYFLGRSVFPAWVDRFHRWIQREAPDLMANELGAGALLGAGVGGFLRRERGRSRRASARGPVTLRRPTRSPA